MDTRAWSLSSLHPKIVGIGHSVTVKNVTMFKIREQTFECFDDRPARIGVAIPNVWVASTISSWATVVPGIAPLSAALLGFLALSWMEPDRTDQ